MSEVKLYMDWGTPEGDDTVVSLFDKEGLAHTVIGYPARVLAETSEENESLRARVAELEEALEKVDELWEGQAGYEREVDACADLAWESPVLHVWKKLRKALKKEG